MTRVLTKFEFYIPNYFHDRHSRMVEGEIGCQREIDVNSEFMIPSSASVTLKLFDLKCCFPYWKWFNNAPRMRASAVDHWDGVSSTSQPRVDYSKQKQKQKNPSDWLIVCVYVSVSACVCIYAYLSICVCTTSCKSPRRLE